jgi:hypothetical protein
VELTLEEVCEVHAARELYSNALQGNIAYTGTETLVWLQAWFSPLLNKIAFPKPPAGEIDGNGSKKTTMMPANDDRRPLGRPLKLDPKRLRLVLDMVREQRIIDISAVLDQLGSNDLRDPLLRSVEEHPNLKAHPGPKTIFLQWRITP